MHYSSITVDESAHYHSIFGLWEEAERICGLTGRTDTRCTIRVLLVVSAKQVFFFFCRLLYMFCVHNLFYWNIYLKMPGWVTNTVFASCNDPNKASNFCRTWENVLTFSHCWFQSYCMWETKLTLYRIRNQFQVQFPIKNE